MSDYDEIGGINMSVNELVNTYCAAKYYQVIEGNKMLERKIGIGDLMDLYLQREIKFINPISEDYMQIEILPISSAEEKIEKEKIKEAIITLSKGCRKCKDCETCPMFDTHSNDCVIYEYNVDKWDDVLGLKRR